MSLERVLNTLVSFGLTQADAEVYLYLAMRGPQQADNIADALEAHEHNLRQSLETLQNRGIVTVESRALFTALPFDKALDQLMKNRLVKVQSIEKKKDEILTAWQAMIQIKNTR